MATLSIGGTIVSDDAAPGTYTVNSDCTGTLTIHMKTDPGNVLSGTIQRVAT